MECVVIILVVIGIGISIVVAAFKKAEEERQRNQPRPGGARGPMRRSGTDLDRFLEEARRRREAGGGEPASRPVADAPWAVPVNRSPVQRPDVQPAPSVRRAPDRPRQSARRPASEARPSIPTARPAQPRTAPPPGPPQAPVVLELVPDDQPAPLALPAALQAPPPPPPKTGGRPSVTPANLKQLPGMLRQPNSLATAFTLGVIFGPPVSRRFR